MNKKARSIDKRIDHIESELKMKVKPTIVIVQCLDDPDFYHISGKPGDLLPGIDAPDYQTYSNGKPGDRMSKQEWIDRLEKDYLVIVVSYEKDWKGDQNV